MCGSSSWKVTTMVKKSQIITRISYFLVGVVVVVSEVPVSAGNHNKLRWNSLRKSADTLYFLRKDEIAARVSSVGARVFSPTRPGGGDGDVAGIFRAIWNVHDDCGEYGVTLPLDDYGIEYNSNHQSKTGNVLNLFGQYDTGVFPYLTRTDPVVAVNGGVPQLANITAHLEKATSDILAAIPDPNFDGIGIIDWEQWYPTWEHINIRYREFSIAHVRNLHPDWDDATVTLVAQLEWTQGAKLFFESTLKLAKQLRPKASWGFYHYPYCLNRYTPNNTCPTANIEANNALMWLFNESTATYPSIYLREDIPGRDAFVGGKLAEAFRMRDKSSDPKGIVLSFVRFNYTHTEFYYSLQDLNATILKSAEFGTHGVVVWGDAYDDNGAQVCSELRDYIKDALGPTVVMARQGASSCSLRICSGHGRCVGNIFTCSHMIRGKWNRNDKSGENVNTDTCSCRCFRGWKGSDCSELSRY